MQIQEMAKKRRFFGKSYALVVSVAPKSDADFLEQWRHIGAALVQWKEYRKKDAETVMLTVVSDPKLHAGFKGIIQKIYTEEAALSPLLKSLNVMVALLNQGGQPQEEYQLGA
jgi:hypothetical protein